MIIFVFGCPLKNNLLICNIGDKKRVSRGMWGEILGKIREREVRGRRYSFSKVNCGINILFVWQRIGQTERSMYDQFHFHG
jgi:hypothetical protein